MRRRAVVLIVLTTVVLTGCLGGPGADTTATNTTDGGETNDVSSEQVPGVTNESLANVTALTAANEAAVSENGGSIRISQPAETERMTHRLVVGADFDTYLLSGSRQTADGKSVAIDIWSNETTEILRSTADGDTRYRALDRDRDRPNFFDSVGDYLSVGDFTVTNETTDAGDVVLTADEYVSSADGPGRLGTVTSFSGRLVVGESGLIQNLTISMSDADETVSYQYELLRTGVDRVPQPDWLSDVPADATLQPRLSVDVENSSYLVVRNEGGDHVPRNATFSVTTNGTTGAATFAAPLETGDTRYAYLDATTGNLVLSADRPDAESVEPVTSPVSITITTDDGVTLHSGSMGWSSESVSAEQAGSSGGTTAVSGGSAES